MKFLSVKTTLIIDSDFDRILENKLDSILPPLNHAERHDTTREGRIQELNNWIRQSICAAYAKGVEEGEKK